MDHQDVCDRLAVAIDGLAGAIERSDLTAAVPTCPGWTVGKLAKHVGLTHRWATDMVRTLAPQRLDMRTVELEWPDDPAAVPEWLRAGGERLVAALRAADPDAGMWAWGADQHARFWPRRMLHEDLVHTADLQAANGDTLTFPAEVAVDAVDELLDNIPGAASFAPKVHELRGNGESIHLHSTDVDGEWMIELHPDGFTWEHAHGKGTVAVRGAAGDLVLLLYGRLPADDARFARFGDDALLDRWLGCTAL